jgi:hypothetical protein
MPYERQCYSMMVVGRERRMDPLIIVTVFYFQLEVMIFIVLLLHLPGILVM